MNKLSYSCCSLPQSLSLSHKYINRYSSVIHPLTKRTSKSPKTRDKYACHPELLGIHMGVGLLIAFLLFLCSIIKHLRRFDEETFSPASNCCAEVSSATFLSHLSWVDYSDQDALLLL